eukprot:3586570-Rhodomonas_salina.2
MNDEGWSRASSSSSSSSPYYTSCKSPRNKVQKQHAEKEWLRRKCAELTLGRNNFRVEEELFSNIETFQNDSEDFEAKFNKCNLFGSDALNKVPIIHPTLCLSDQHHQHQNVEVEEEERGNPACTIVNIKQASTGNSQAPSEKPQGRARASRCVLDESCFTQTLNILLVCACISMHAFSSVLFWAACFVVVALGLVLEQAAARRWKSARRRISLTRRERTLPSLLKSLYQ